MRWRGSRREFGAGLAEGALSADRRELDTAVLARDTAAESGPPPSDDTWNVDHPTAKTVQLADGQWHNVMVMRVCDHGEVSAGMAPAPESGTFSEEVVSGGEPIPAWRF